MKIVGQIMRFLMLTLAIPFLLSACSSGEPEELTFDLEITGGKLTLDPPVIKVNQDDQVTLRITSDEAGELHLHGYDLEAMLSADGVSVLAFTANATGKFDFELHTGEVADHEHDDGGHDEEVCQAELSPGAVPPVIHISASPGPGPGEIRVSVDIDNFILGDNAGESGIASGHWHLFADGDLMGMYDRPDAIIFVREPGEHELTVTISDADHCDYGVQAMTVVTVEGGSGVMDDGGTQTEGEDILLGSLEVHPR